MTGCQSFCRKPRSRNFKINLTFCPTAIQFQGMVQILLPNFPCCQISSRDRAVCQEPSSLSPAVRVWLPEKMGAVDGAKPRGSGPGVSRVSMGPRLLQFQFRPLLVLMLPVPSAFPELKRCPSGHQILRGLLSVCNPSFRFGPSFRDPAAQPEASSEIPFHTIPDSATPQGGHATAQE